MDMVSLIKLGPIGVGVLLLLMLLHDKKRSAWVPIVTAVIAGLCILLGLAVVNSGR